MMGAFIIALIVFVPEVLLILELLLINDPSTAGKVSFMLSAVHFFIGLMLFSVYEHDDDIKNLAAISLIIFALFLWTGSGIYFYDAVWGLPKQTLLIWPGACEQP